MDILLDTVFDTLKLLPFLFSAFLIIEYFEHHFSEKTKKAMQKSGKFGPIIGAVLGLVPQCGFSVIATNLYITKIISLGTLISIYLATSDEMLPIMISLKVDYHLIIIILVIKFLVGVIWGLIIDLVYRKKRVVDYHLCEEENCDCKHGIFKSSLIHTLKITAFIFIATLILNILFHYLGNEYLSKLLMKDSIFGSFFTSLIGLIPNCGSSVLITELFLNNTITFGALISGLLTGSGVALLVLFKANKKLKENFLILGLVYVMGVITGIIIDIINIIG